MAGVLHLPLRVEFCTTGSNLSGKGMKSFAQKILNGLRWMFIFMQGKKQGRDFHNIYHPDFYDAVEPAFKAAGKQYYRFRKETSIPWGRYMFMQTFLKEQELRMDLKTLHEYVTRMKHAVNGSVAKGIDLITVIKTLTQMESRIELAFEVDTTYRLASVMFFDDQEDLYTYDKAHNDKKIQTWKECRAVDFFYTMPMSELLGLNNSSPEGLRQFIDSQVEILRDLAADPISETPAP
jgi:hypothetical protein